MLGALKDDELFLTLDYSRKELEEMRKDTFICPGCKGKVSLRIGKVKIPHFAHEKNFTCDAFSEPESQQHLALKKAFYTWGEDSELECYLPNLSQRPDVLLEKKVALEIQCSTLKVERLWERTKNYLEHDYEIFWIVGEHFFLKDRMSQLQLGMMNYSKNFGFYLWEADVKKQELRLKYFITQDLSGKIYYQVQSFPFFKGNLREILELPSTQFAKVTRKIFSDKVTEQLMPKLKYQIQTYSPVILEVQQYFYSQNGSLLTLPKCYGYNPTLPIVVRAKGWIWKEKMYAFLQTPQTILELENFFLSELQHLFLFPQYDLKEVIQDFLISELRGQYLNQQLLFQKEKIFLLNETTSKKEPLFLNFSNICTFLDKIPRKYDKILKY